jgi:DNA invertase Pin-like site-specific DNA recombinase
MRTQPPQRPRPARGLRPGAALGFVALLVPATPAAAQGGAGSSGPPAALLLGAAAVLLLLAVAIGYGVPALRRRSAGHGVVGLHVHDPRSAHFTRMDPGLPEMGDAPAGRSARVTHSGRPLALGYTTFPDRRRAVSPESRYQARRIAAACEARDIVLHQLVGDVQSYSGPDLDRPGLNHALDSLGAGEASCLVVVGLDRLSRSAANLGTVIEWLEDMGARLVVIDIDLDTDTHEGRLAARALCRVGALERQTGRGEPRGGVRPIRTLDIPRGRPAVADLPLLQRRIATMRASGMTLQAIADTLNSEGIPTLRGGTEWRPSSVQAATGYKRPNRP